jgi:hypothetical protein
MPQYHKLVCGSTQVEMLVQFLDEVLGACHDVGLHVVATVCDMGANNVKAMKHMRDKVSTSSEPFFKFLNQEIAIIYDPPHLLKCTLNLFRKYNVEFKSEHVDSQLPFVAKWEHIENVYKQDKQVMNYTIAAYIYSLVSHGK